MRLINFITLYQYFDAIEYKYSNQLQNYLNKNINDLSIYDLQIIYDLKIQLKLIEKIYKELIELIIDL